MRIIQWQRSLFLAAWLALGMASSALAEGEPISRVQSKQVIRDIPSLNEVNQPLTAAEGLLVQQPAPTPAQVTGVQLKPTDQGLEVFLQTSGTFDEVLTSSTENNLITDIPNAQLLLPIGGTFRQDNPTQDIASVEVTNLDAKTIRIIVTGKTGVPTAEVSQSPQALILSVAAPSAPSAPPTAPEPTPAPEQQVPPQAVPAPEAKEEAPVELTVKAEEEAGGYNVPDASTATRTDTPILDIPASIQVVPQQVIKDQQVIRLEEALQNVSGVTFRGNTQGRDETFSIRGFGSPFSAAPVLRDGFRTYSFYTGFPEVAGLERVEVLKGPASILYGDVQPGGLINLISKQPLSQPFYETELQIGSRELVRPRFDITGPLTADGSLLYRLNGLYQHSTSFRDFTTDRDRVFIAPALNWKIDQNTDFSVSLDYTHDKGPADQGLAAFGDRVAPIPYTRVLNDPGDNITNQYLTTGYTFEHRFSDNWKIRNAFRYIDTNYNYNVAAVPLSISATGIVDRLFATQDSTEQSYSIQTNVQGKFNTGSVRHTPLFGVDFNHSDRSLNSSFNPSVPLAPLDIFNPVYVPKPDIKTFQLLSGTRDNDNRVGIYLQDQLYLLDNLIVLGGLRYDTVTQKTTALSASSSASESTRDNDALTPRVGIVYQPIKELSLYSSYSQSFTPNSATTVSGTSLEPERGEGYEVGVKTDLLNSQLFATLAYFDITKRNVAVTDPNNPLFFIATGKQQSNGVELDITGKIMPGWNVIANYAYINARVTADTNSALVGGQLPGVPFHSAGLWTTYQIQRGNLKGLGFGFGFNYVGEREGSLPNSFRVDSYFVPNAAIFYQRDRLRFAINFRNLFDTDYIKAADTGRANGVEPGDPFTAIGSISVEF